MSSGIELDFKKFKDATQDLVDNWEDKVSQEMVDLAGIRHRHISDAIDEVGAVDTGNLRNSYIVSGGRLEGMVSTNVEYANFVNDGHMQHKRFVPGEWKGDRFIYKPSSRISRFFSSLFGGSSGSTGMMLEEKWIKGRQFMEKAQAKSVPKEKAHLQRFMETTLKEAGE